MEQDKREIGKWDRELILQLTRDQPASRKFLLSSVQFSSVSQSCPTLYDPMECSTPGFPVLHHLPRLAQTHVTKLVMPSNHLSLYCPLLLPSIFSIIRVFSSESALHKWWPKYWSFSFSISPSKEYSVFISFSIDGFDLLAIQGILKSLLQHYNSKASILQWPAFFMVQLSYLYMTTGKIIALTTQTFVSKVMSLLFNMLSRFIISFLPRSKCLLIHGWSDHLQWFWNTRK